MTEKSFKNFLELPAKDRMLIIDEMKPDDRCRFTRTSKICNTEAKSSKNYLGYLEFEYHSEDELKILIKYGRYHCFVARRSDISLDIKKEADNKKYMKCIKLGGEELWRMDLNDSTNLVEFADQCFNNLLELYQNQIKRLNIRAKCENVYDFDIKATSFERLEHIDVMGNVNVTPFLTRTKGPLKTFYVTGENHEEFPMEKIYSVQNGLAANLTLNNDQFSRLSAATVITDIGDVTADHIYNFIRSWQNGTVGRKLKWYKLNIRDTSFDIQRLFRLFGHNYDNREMVQNEVHVPHLVEAGKKS